MERRKIANEAEARKALATITKRGISIREWAGAHGVDGRSLHAWALAFARRGKRATRPQRAGLIELVPTAASRSAARYVLRLGDVDLEFGDDAQEETLRRVVWALRSC